MKQNLSQLTLLPTESVTDLPVNIYLNAEFNTEDLSLDPILNSVYVVPHSDMEIIYQ